jgi:hypothetical protein
MRLDPSPNVASSRIGIGFKGGELHPSSGPRWRRACAGLAFAAAFTCIAQDGHPPAAPVAESTVTSKDQTTVPANAQPHADPANSEAANAQAKESSPVPQSPPDSQRRLQISAESTQLLAMAADLKAEVDKTNKDTLSLSVIRKADAIERLAKTVREKMKQGSGPS